MADVELVMSLDWAEDKLAGDKMPAAAAAAASVKSMALGIGTAETAMTSSAKRLGELNDDYGSVGLVWERQIDCELIEGMLAKYSKSF